MNDATRIQTGLRQLDTHTGGGIPFGTLTTYVSDPRTESELFLYQLLNKAAATYVTTLASRSTAQAQLNKSPVNIGSTSVVSVSPTSVFKDLTEAITQRSNTDLLVIDSINPVERGPTTSRAQLHQLLNTAQTRASDAGMAVVFHRHATPSSSPPGPVFHNLTNARSDIIIEFTSEVDGNNVNTYLDVPKCRPSESAPERLKVTATSELSIDASRDIS